MNGPDGIAFALPAANSLLETGRLGEAWLSSFVNYYQPPTPDNTWRPDFVRLHHFVVGYLPLRYLAWTKSENERNHETERKLALVTVVAAERLWEGVCQTAPLPEEQELMRLVFGSENPLRVPNGGRTAWEKRFSAALDVLERDDWRARAAWPRWIAMALHTVSFYFPLGLPEDHAPSARNRVDHAARRVLAGLSERLHPDVVTLVAHWLAAAEATRDSAGVPSPDWSPEDRHRFFARTRIEQLLLGSSSPSTTVRGANSS